MKPIVPALGALLLLAACTPAENAASVATPATTPAPESTTIPEPTASPTAAPVEKTTVPETTLEEWVSVMPEQKSGYTVTEGTLELQEGVAWPDQPVTLQIYGLERNSGRGSRDLWGAVGNAAGPEPGPGNVGT